MSAARDHTACGERHRVDGKASGWLRQGSTSSTADHRICLCPCLFLFILDHQREETQNNHSNSFSDEMLACGHSYRATKTVDGFVAVKHESGGLLIATTLEFGMGGIEDGYTSDGNARAVMVVE